MQSPLESAIRHQLRKYLTSEQSLDEFKDWLVGETWDIERRNDPAAEALTYEIKLRMAEQSSDDCTEADLKRLLRPLMESPVGVATES